MNLSSHLQTRATTTHIWRYVMLTALAAASLVGCGLFQPQEQQQEARGLSTPRDILLHGIVAGTTFQTNQGFTLQNGSSLHANSGLVLNSRNIITNGGQVSSTNTATCADNSGMGFCLNGKPKTIAPVVVVPKPDIAALRTKYSQTPSNTIQGILNLNSSSDISTRFDNKVTQIKGSLNLNAIATIKNATVIVDETLNSNKGIVLENSVVLTKQVQLNQNTTLNNSRIISSEDLTVNGKLESNQNSSLISSKNVTTNQTVNSASGELAIVANLNITTNQGQTGKISLWAGGNITTNQSSRLEGSVTAGGAIRFNQAVTLTKVLQHGNTDIFGEAETTSITATLQPGGTMVGPDGASITAPVGALLEPVEMTITREDPTTLPPLPDYSHLPEYPKISSFYRVKPSVDIYVDDPQVSFKISIPVNKTYEDGASIEFGMLVITRSSIYRKDIPFLWTASSGSYNATTKQVDIELGGIKREGEVFFIIDYSIPKINTSSQGLQLQQTPSSVQIECPRPADCTPAFISNALSSYNAKKSVYETAIGRKLRLTLIRIVSQNTCAQEFVNGNIAGGTYSHARREIVMCLNKANGVIFFGLERANPPITFSHSIKHEMFHAAQGAFYNTTKAAETPYQSLFHEGTAEMAVNSTDVRTEVSSRVTRNLVTRFADIGSPTEPDFYSYTLQDFWAYLGRDNGRGLSYLKGFLEFFAKNLNSDVVANLDGLLAKSPSELSQFTTPLKKYNGGLSQVYWSWIKNLGYESQNQYKLRNEVPCEINRLATTDAATMPSLNYVFGSGKIPVSWRLSPLQAAYTEIKPTGNIKTQLRISIEKTFFDQGMKAKVFRSKLSSQNRASAGCVQIPDLTPAGTVFENIDDDTVFFLIVANPTLSIISRPVVIIEPVTAQPTTNPSSITLNGTVGKTVEQDLIIQNIGDMGSDLNYTIYPIGTNPDPNNSDPALEPRRIRNPLPIVSATRPQNSPWSAELYSSQEYTLRRTATSTEAAGLRLQAANVIAGQNPEQKTKISASCPIPGAVDFTFVNVVYETGLTDDNGTPDVLGDDTPELYMKSVPVWYQCNTLVIDPWGTVNLGIKSDGSLWKWGGVNTNLTPTLIENGVSQLSPYMFSKGQALWSLAGNLPKVFSTFPTTIQEREHRPSISRVLLKDGTVYCETSMGFQVQTNTPQFNGFSGDSYGYFDLNIDVNKNLHFSAASWANLERCDANYYKVNNLDNVIDTAAGYLYGDGYINSSLRMQYDMVGFQYLAIKSDGSLWEKRQDTVRNFIYASIGDVNSNQFSIQNLQNRSNSKPQMSSLNSPSDYFIDELVNGWQKVPINFLVKQAVYDSFTGIFYLLDQNGQMWSWKSNSPSSSMTRFSTLTNVVGLSQNLIYGTQYAVCQDGSVWGWGMDVQGSITQYDPSFENSFYIGKYHKSPVVSVFSNVIAGR
jgi:hypothetical protein